MMQRLVIHSIEQRKESFVSFSQARILNAAKSKLAGNRRDLPANQKKISTSRGSSKTRVR